MQKMPTTRKKVVQRKFPGPAGLLTTCETSFEKQSWKDLSLNTSINERVIIYFLLDKRNLVELFVGNIMFTSISGCI